MTIDTLTNDILALNDNFFDTSFDIIDLHFDFIDTNALIQPKENYLLTFEFLNTSMNHFTNLDFNFVSKTLKKLHRDINNLYKLYQMHQDYVSDIKKLFEEKFEKKIELLIQMKNEIAYIQNSDFMDDYDKETIEIITKQYAELKSLYFKIFKDDFIDQNNNLISSMKSILNTKLFYFDQLLWIQANKSDALKRLFKPIDTNENINSKLYIKHRLSIDLPYTDDYHYLSRCLRIYK